MTTTAPLPVTARQREVLAWIAAYIDAHGFSPTFRDVRDAFGFKSPNGAACHFLPLRKRGLLTWMEHSSRTLRITPAGEEVLRGN